MGLLLKVVHKVPGSEKRAYEEKAHVIIDNLIELELEGIRYIGSFRMAFGPDSREYNHLLSFESLSHYENAVHADLETNVCSLLEEVNSLYVVESRWEWLRDIREEREEEEEEERKEERE